MADTATPPKPQRRRNAPHKLNRQKALELHSNGLGSHLIGQALGVAPSTVWRYLQSIQADRAQTKQYVDARTEVFQHIQAKSLDLQHRILDRFTDGFLAAMEPHQIANLLDRVNTVFGTTYDKERLESGKSTQNVGIVARMMGDALDSAYLGKDEGSAPK